MRAMRPMTTLVRGRGGFTLVEVLVALVILGVGVYASIAIFPTGFAAMEYNRHLTTAARLAQSEVQRWKDRASALPDAIVARNPATGVVTTNFNPTRLVFNAANPNWQPDAVWLPRTVIGETVMVPSARGLPNYEVPTYVLTMSPLAPGAGAADLVVYSTPYHELDDRTDLSSTGDRQQFYVDITSGDVFFDTPAASIERRVRIEYQYYRAERTGGVITGQTIVSVVNDPPSPAVLPAGINQLTVSAAADADFQGIVPGTMRVYQAFRWVTDAAELPLEEGEFYAPASALVTGVLQFAEQDAGRTVKVDYQVADWQILREEKTLGADGRMQLTCAPVKQATDDSPRNPNAQYLDVVSGRQIAVVAVNVNTGEALYGSTDVTETPLGAYAGSFKVDYLTGVCTFVDGAAGAGRVGGTWRVMYRSLDEWTLQVAKAADYYVASGTAAARADQTYTLAGSTLTFAPCEADKMICMDYTYNDGGVRTPIDSALFHLDENSELQIPNLLSIEAVRGVSLQVRAIWVGRGNDKAEGGQPSGGRLSVQSIETYLTRSE